MRLRALLLLLAVSIVAWAQLPVVPPGSIVNGASFSASEPIAAGSLISIFGSHLSTSLQHADTVPLSTSLGGVTVEFVNGSQSLPARMLDTIPSSNQLNVQVPWGIVPPNAPPQSVNVVVTVAGVGSSQPTPVTVGPFSPAIFPVGSRAIVQNFSDGTLAQPAGSIPGLTTHPARPGDVLVIYATGLGAVSSPPADGDAAGSVERDALTPPIVMVGNISAHVIGTALSPQFVGVYQVAIFVPANAPAGDAVPIQIQMGGVNSPSLTMAITP